MASEGPRQRIAEVLRRHALKIDSFDSLEELLDEPNSQPPAVIVLWAQDTISASSTLVEPLAGRFAHSAIVLVCAEIERWAVRSTLAAGAAGVVLLDDLDRTLGPCLQAVQAGQTCVPRGHWRQIQPPALSTREKQILALVVMGYMNSQIAAQLFLAESTVKSHLSSAFGKLGVRSRNEAAGLILDPQRGLGMGILALDGEPVASTHTASS
ncbi:MAG TPA: response regulator transcription factor [Clostridia bacterium]|nr:response regulator transcription factor [Clostridia bacterium]